MSRPRAGQLEVLWAGRLGVVAIAAIAFGLAMDPDSRVLDLVAYAWAGFGAAQGAEGLPPRIDSGAAVENAVAR